MNITIYGEKNNVLRDLRNVQEIWICGGIETILGGTKLNNNGVSETFEIHLSIEQDWKESSDGQEARIWTNNPINLETS